ncbi:MAG: PDZ domain-containing protein [Tannerella sp.]|jgi:hypothetical protein|nr:PDZ domain-containing protein [Tannerella sp.]
MKNYLKMKACSLILIVTLMSSCQSDRSLYVSLAGDDACPGTEKKPVATLRKALEIARTEKDKRVTVYLRGGTYYLEEPVLFTAGDSRAEDAGLTVRAFGDERAVISGARRLPALTWEACREGIMKASVAAAGTVFDELFVNGQLQHPARYPDYDPGARYYNGVAADAVAPERVAGWNNPAGGYVHASHRHEWGGFHWMITGKNGQGELALEGGWQNNRRMGMHPERRFVENIREELDAPGEWFFDRETRTLYFYPPEDVNLPEALLETPQLASLFEFRGNGAEPVRNIRIEGLELTHTVRTFMNTREPLLRSDWTICRSGAVFMEGAVHCSVRNCFFNTVGGNAVFFSNYNRENEVSGCHIAHAGASGICFVGDPQAVRSPAFEYGEFVPLAELDREPGPKTDNYPSACRACDNLICGPGRVEKQVAGVQISMAQDITVSHNTVYDVPRAGINISDGTWGGHLIAYNDVFNTVLETGDHGAFNSWGRDRYWHPDYATMAATVSEHPELVLLDAVKTTVLCNNRFRCDHGWDIDLDDGSANYHIYNNLCLNGGLKLREGFHRTVENNILINNSFHPHVWFAASGDVFVRNIVSADYFPIRVRNWGREVDRNVFPDRTALDKAQAAGTDPHSVYGDIQYVDARHGDFRVKEGSVAFSTGFKNFDMHRFGVLSPRLKALAKQVPVPEPVRLTGNGEDIQELLGMKVKNITTPGERSAAGLGDASGVWLIELPEGNPATAALRPNDVITGINHMPVKNVREMREALIRAGSRITVRIFRNQREQEVILR